MAGISSGGDGAGTSSVASGHGGIGDGTMDLISGSADMGASGNVHVGSGGSEASNIIAGNLVLNSGDAKATSDAVLDRVHLVLIGDISLKHGTVAN
jgi:hypothetical protein